MSIKDVRVAEATRKAAKADAEKKAAMLKDIKPLDIVETINEVKKGLCGYARRDEAGHTTGTNGGRYYQEAVRTPDGRLTTIAGNYKEDVDAIKARMKDGIMGDGLLHKTVIIGGIPCDCCGKDEDELKADIEAAEIHAAKHPGIRAIRDVDVAEQLVEAELDKDDLEEVEARGLTFILNYTGKYIMNLGGETIVSLDDLKSKLGKEDIKTILMERLNNHLDELFADEFDDDDDDCCDCDEDDEDDEEDDE